MKTKIDIFSGFLGAGKTTLIKKLIKEAYCGEKIVIIENEFGDVGIDGGFLSEAGIEITEMNSGCICCSLVGDFGEALKKVAAEFSPDRIIIEPSGVGKLSDVIRAVKNAGIDGMETNSFTAVVDALKCKMYMKNFAEFYRNQIEFASAVILSRTDSISREKLIECIEIIREINKSAVLVTTPWEQIDGKSIVEAVERKNTLEKELELLLEQQKAADKRHLHHDGHEHHHHGDECDDPDCDCHHGHDHDEGGHEHYHHGNECDDPDCDCHHGHDHDEDEHQHHHHDDECDDPDCNCHHGHDHDEDEHEHHHHGDECDDPDCDCHHGHDHDEDGREHHYRGDECDDPECDCHHEHRHSAGEVFVSWGAETAGFYTAEGITACLDELETGKFGTILRAKGIVCREGGDWIHFDYVPGEKSVRSGIADVTGKLCVIGTGLRKTELAVLFGIK